MYDGFPAPSAHILTLDDDPAVRQLIAAYLSDYDLRVTTVARECEMTSVLSREAVDVLLLDLRLDDESEDGVAIARKVRASSKLPIIIVSGKHDESDRVKGLEAGADDYVTKPFSPRELLARIRAVLRRSQGEKATARARGSISAYRFGDWQLSLRLRNLVSTDGRLVALCRSEFNLLLAFLSSPRHVLSRAQLLELSRLHDAEVFDRSIDVQVGRLRRKLGSDGRSQRLIVTERGVGYYLDADVEVIRH
jgi:DNA-binding response OmpR family regulator